MKVTKKLHFAGCWTIHPGCRVGRPFSQKNTASDDSDQGKSLQSSNHQRSHTRENKKIRTVSCCENAKEIENHEIQILGKNDVYETEARKTNCGPRTGIWLYKQIPKHSNLNLMVECQCVCDPRTRDRNGGLRDSVQIFIISNQHIMSTMDKSEDKKYILFIWNMYVA